MKLVQFAAIAGLASIASAIPFQPLKAKLLKLSMVVAYDECSPPNSTHRPPLGVSCAPPAPTSATDPADVTSFGPEGQLRVQLKAAKGDLKVVVKGKDIINNGSSYTGDLNLSMTLRLTDDANVGPGFTMPGTTTDFGFSVPIACVDGVCEASTTFNALVAGLFAEGEAANIQLLQLQVEDRNGDVAFRPGLFVP